MHVVAVEKQHSDKVSNIASTASSSEAETGALLSSAPSHSDTDGDKLKPSDQEVWYQQPKEECVRQAVLEYALHVSKAQDLEET